MTCAEPANVPLGPVCGGAVNVTMTPGTPIPPASLIVTPSRVPKGAPTFAVCGVVFELAAMVEGTWTTGTPVALPDALAMAEAPDAVAIFDNAVGAEAGMFTIIVSWGNELPPVTLSTESV